MKNLGFYNGKIDELENMQVPMLDRACYFGDGVYDASYANNHTIFALQDHLNRFYNSARLLNIKIPYEKEELQDLLISLVKKVDSPTQFVYWQVSRGTGIRNHIYSDDMVGNLWVMITPKALTDPNKEMSVVTMEDTRFFHNNIKTINLIPAVMYSTDAHNHGYDECILLIVFFESVQFRNKDECLNYEHGMKFREKNKNCFCYRKSEHRKLG